jgi:tetratricopeptide (TPR) repeat protein
MNTAVKVQNGQPNDAAIRAQVERMTKSTVFANSPQLASFLVFVVEALLRGKSGRLKGYTIGVEVLRRDTSFDPQIDPIVRVEATRLRRAIDRYYAGPGADDEIVITLPRGGYVPRVTRRAAAPPAVAQAAEGEALGPGNGMPTLRVAPFVVMGRPGRLVIDGETLSSKLCEAFALFDMINVIGAAPNAPQGRIDYRLDGTLEYRGDETVCLRFRLVDKMDETVIWSRSFEHHAGENHTEIERDVIRDLSTSVVQRFGIIWSHERARQFAANVGDPRHRALIQAGEAFRSFDLAAYARARQELERLTAIDPGFAAGFTYLGLVSATDYVHGLGGPPNDISALDRALKFARRGVELKPHSAFAYHILFVILFFRGETEAACAAAEKAIALNPNDIVVLADYGGRLIFSGQVDKGMEILNRTVAFGAILPSWAHFYMFLGHYLREELPEARFHASQMTSESYFYGRLARALMAYRDGQTEEAQRVAQAILSDQPRWIDPRREIGKLIIDPVIADRLTRDLAEAGLRPPDAAARGDNSR